MGHTALSQRRALDTLLAELKDYGKSLRPEERKALEEVLREPLKHVGSITYASSIHVWGFLLLSVIIEQQKKIKRLELDMAHRHLPKQEQAHPLAENA
jgi:hypothetical protein